MAERQEKVVTIRDISEKLKVSVTSVHRALQGKEGVSDSLRDEILKTAQEMGYVPNYIAASMKRKNQKIAVVFPTDAAGRKLYFDYAWEGLWEYSQQLKVLNLEVEEYRVEDEEEQYRCLKQIADGGAGAFAGVVTFSFTRSPQVLMQLQRLVAQDIKTVVVDDDLKEPEGLFCIPPDEKTIGRLAGEFIGLVTPEEGTVLVSGGRESSKVHTNKIESFREYLREHKPGLKVQVVKGYSSQTGRDNPLYQETVRALEKVGDVKAVYALTSYDNLPMIRALEDKGYLEKVRMIGSDINGETKALLSEGKLSAVINQSAYEKGYMGMKIVADAVLKRTEPMNKNFCSINVVLKSNMKFYI